MDPVMVDLSGVDWALLRRQKEWLMTQDGEGAEGLLSLLDYVQDEAVDRAGLNVDLVFGPGDGE